jgi:hypothetical protein
MNTTSVVCQFCLSKHVVYFFTAIGSEDIPFFHCSFVLCLSFASTSGVTLYTNYAGAVDTENLNLKSS